MADERARRKAVWIGRATAHMDSPKTRKQASVMFEKANPVSSQRGSSTGRIVRPAKLPAKPKDDLQLPQ